MEIKKRVGKHIGRKTIFDPVLYNCSNAKCRQGIMTDNYGINTCPTCGEKTNVIPPKNER